jgi:hypothetical protein
MARTRSGTADQKVKISLFENLTTVSREPVFIVDLSPFFFLIPRHLPIGGMD